MNNKFGWAGAFKSSAMLLQDYHFWKNLLLLLEGEIVKMQAPENVLAEKCIDSLGRCYSGFLLLLLNRT